MSKQFSLPKKMKPIIFKGKKNATIEVFFKANDWGFQPILVSSNNRAAAVPLLMDLTQIIATNLKLHHLDKEKEFPFEYLRNVVAGACSLTMKRGF